MLEICLKGTVSMVTCAAVEIGALTAAVLARRGARVVLVDINAAKTDQFGIALAGGGSKASAFGTGVLAGLADSNMLD